MSIPEPLDAVSFPALTERQRVALPIALAAPTVNAGLQAAGISRSTWHRWKLEPAFRQALTELQREGLRESIGDLEGGSRYAVSSLLGLLTSKDERVRLAAARDTLTLALRGAELLDLETRIARIEDVLGPLAEAAEP